MAALLSLKPAVGGAPIPPEPKVSVIDAAWVIYRIVPKGFARASRPPRFRHHSFESALDEARRLSRLNPESKFVLLQERAIVTMKDAA